MNLQDEIVKNLINESYNDNGYMRDTVEVSTGLSDKEAEKILGSVIGQLSDGIWENTPQMEKYWKSLSIDKSGSDIKIIFGTGWGSNRQGYTIDSPFRDKSENELKKWYAAKIKQIVKEEGLDWNRNNEEFSHYIKGTVRDAYRVYDKLLGRKEYIPDPNKKTEAKLLESTQELTNTVNKAFQELEDAEVPPANIEYNGKKYRYWPLINDNKGDGKTKCMYFYPADKSFVYSEEYFTVLYQKKKKEVITSEGIDKVLEVDDTGLTSNKTESKLIEDDSNEIASKQFGRWKVIVKPSQWNKNKLAASFYDMDQDPNKFPEGQFTGATYFIKDLINGNEYSKSIKDMNELRLVNHVPEWTIEKEDLNNIYDWLVEIDENNK